MISPKKCSCTPIVEAWASEKCKGDITSDNIKDAVAIMDGLGNLYQEMLDAFKVSEDNKIVDGGSNSGFGGMIFSPKVGRANGDTVS